MADKDHVLESSGYVLNGSYVCLYAEEQGEQGYAVVSDYMTKKVDVCRGESDLSRPPDFEISSVFQIKSLDSLLKDGEQLRFGDLVCLVHRSTGKVLCSYASNLQVIRANNVQTYRNCHFALMHRFKSQAGNDYLRLNEQVVLECAWGPIPRKKVVLEEGRGLGLDTRASTGIRLKLFARHDIETAFAQNIKGGNIVRLYHIESHGFLTVTTEETDLEGRTASINPKVVVEVLDKDEGPNFFKEVHSLWQVELASQSGEALVWSEGVRLKNLVTGTYMNVKGDPGNCLQPDVTRDGTSVLQVVSTDPGLTPESIVSITDTFYISKDSTQWINVDHRQMLDERKHVTDWSQKDEIVKTKNEIYAAVTYGMNRSDHDAFTFVNVNLQETTRYFEVKKLLADLLPLFESDTLLDADLSVIKAIDFFSRASTKDEEEDIMLHDGVPQLEAQDFLYDMDIDDILMHVISRPFRQIPGKPEWGKEGAGWEFDPDKCENKGHKMLSDPRCANFNSIATHAIRAVRQMCKGNETIGAAIGNKYAPRLLAFAVLTGENEEVNWPIMDLVGTVFGNNTAMLRQVDSEFIGSILGVLNEGKALNLVDFQEYYLFLTACMAKHGYPLGRNQSIIIDSLESEELKLLKLNAKNGKVFIEAPIITVESTFSSAERKSIMLSNYLSKKEDEAGTTPAEHRNFVNSTIDLLSHTLIGRNERSQNVIITKYITFDLWLSALVDPGIAISTKAKLVSLGTNLFVDCPGAPQPGRLYVLNRRLEDLRNTSGEKENKDIFLALLKKLNTTEQMFAELLTWLHDTLAKEKLDTDASDKQKRRNSTVTQRTDRGEKENETRKLEEEEARNHLFREVLNMLYYIVDLGIYTAMGRSTRDLASTLLDLLWVSRATSMDAFKVSGSHNLVMKAKIKVINILQLCVMDILANTHLPTLLAAFHKQMVDPKVPKPLAVDVPSILHKFHMDLWFKTLKPSENDAPWEQTKGFVYMMLDLTRYQDSDLAFAAMGLLTSSFNFKGELLCILDEQGSVSMQIAIADEDVQFLSSLMEALREGQEPGNERKIEFFKYLALQCVDSSQQAYPSLAVDTPASSEHSRTDTVAEVPVVENLTNYEGGDDLDTGGILIPAKRRQDMLRNESVHTIVLEYLVMELGPNEYIGDIFEDLKNPSTRRAIKLGFEALSAFAWGNDMNKLELCRLNFDFLVYACQFGVGAESTLSRVLEENPEAHIVFLNNRHVEELCAYLVDDNVANCHTPAYLRLLCHIIRPGVHQNMERLTIIGNIFLSPTKGGAGDLLYTEILGDHGDASKGGFIDILSTYYSTPAAQRDEDENTLKAIAMARGLIKLLSEFGDTNIKLRSHVQRSIGNDIFILEKLTSAIQVANEYPAGVLNDILSFGLAVVVHDVEDDEIEAPEDEDPEMKKMALERLKLMTSIFDSLRQMAEKQEINRDREVQSMVSMKMLPLLRNAIRRSAQFDTVIAMRAYAKDVAAPKVKQFFLSACELLESTHTYLDKVHRMTLKSVQTSVVKYMTLMLEDFRSTGQLLDTFGRTVGGYIEACKMHSLQMVMDWTEEVLDTEGKERKDAEMQNNWSRAYTEKQNAIYLQAFQKVDEDSNGVIEGDELNQLLKLVNETITMHQPFDIEQLLRRFDKNHDGQLDFHEFCSFLDVVKDVWNQRTSTEQRTFTHQVRRHFGATEESYNHEDDKNDVGWMHGGPKDVQFPEFEELVSIIRAELLVERSFVNDEDEYSNPMSPGRGNIAEQMLNKVSSAKKASISQVQKLSDPGSLAIEMIGIAQNAAHNAFGSVGRTGAPDGLLANYDNHTVHDEMFAMDGSTSFMQNSLTSLIQHLPRQDKRQLGGILTYTLEAEETVIATIQMLCKLLCANQEGDKNDEAANIRNLAMKVNAAECPQTVLALMTAVNPSVFDFACRLGVQMLKCSPEESLIEHQAEIHLIHPHTQKMFMGELKNGTAGGQAMEAMGRLLDNFSSVLLRESSSDERDYPPSSHELQQETLKARCVMGTLRFIEHLTKGRYTPAQNFLRDQSEVDLLDVNVVEKVVRLSTDLGNLIARNLRGLRRTGLGDVRDVTMISEVHWDLVQESNLCDIVAQVFSTMVQLSTGPNEPNQELILHNLSWSAFLEYLYYFQHERAEAMRDGGSVSLDTVRLDTLDLLDIWMKDYGVTLSKTYAHKSSQLSYAGPNCNEFRQLAASYQILNKLDSIDEITEFHMLTLLVVLLDGRQRGDPVIQTMTTGLLNPASASKNRSNIYVKNAIRHFKIYTELREKRTRFSIVQKIKAFGMSAKGGLVQLGRALMLTKGVEDNNTDDEIRHFDVACLYYICLLTLSRSAVLMEIRAAVDGALEQFSGACDIEELASDVRQIELVDDNGELYAMYFRIPYEVKKVLGRHSVEGYRSSIDESCVQLQQGQKAKAFLSEATAFLRFTMMQATYQKYFFTSFLSNEEVITDTALLIVVFLNASLMFQLEGKHGMTSSVQDVCKYIHLLLAFLKMSCYWMNWYSRLLGRIPTWNHAIESPSVYFLRVFFYFVTRYHMLYNFMYIISSIYAATSNIDWIGFCLLEIVLKLPVLADVMQAISSNADKLLATFLLMFVTIYLFALYGRNNFVNIDYTEEAGYDFLNGPYHFYNSEHMCAPGSAFTDCIKAHWYHGIKDSPLFDFCGGAGTSPELCKELTNKQFAFGMLYYIIVLQIMLSIVAGIIIDSFGAMRDMRDEKRNIMQSRCFTCGIARMELENTCREGFEGHVKLQHDPWSFVYLMAYLEEIHSTKKTMTGAELKVWNKWRQGQIDSMWPSGRALCVENYAAESRMLVGDEDTEEDSGALKRLLEEAIALLE